MESIIRQFKGREHGPVVQFIKYGICGCAAVAVHIGIFYALAAWVLPALTTEDLIRRILHLPTTDIARSTRAWHAAVDTTIAFLFSNLTAYVLNILWVFKRGRHPLLLELAMFYAVSGVSVLIGTSIQTYLIGRFDMTTTVAFGANLVSALVINFAMRKFVIFKG